MLNLDRMVGGSKGKAVRVVGGLRQARIIVPTRGKVTVKPPAIFAEITNSVSKRGCGERQTVRDRSLPRRCQWLALVRHVGRKSRLRRVFGKKSARCAMQCNESRRRAMG